MQKQILDFPSVIVWIKRHGPPETDSVVSYSTRELCAAANLFPSPAVAHLRADARTNKDGREIIVSNTPRERYDAGAAARFNKLLERGEEGGTRAGVSHPPSLRGVPRTKIAVALRK